MVALTPGSLSHLTAGVGEPRAKPMRHCGSGTSARSSLTLVGEGTRVRAHPSPSGGGVGGGHHRVGGCMELSGGRSRTTSPSGGEGRLFTTESAEDAADESQFNPLCGLGVLGGFVFTSLAPCAIPSALKKFRARSEIALIQVSHNRLTPAHAAHFSDSASACSSTVWVARSCLSVG